MVYEILFEDFVSILGWEIEQIKRFQCPDEFCVMYVKPEFAKDLKKLKEIIKEVLRNSDLITSIEEHIFILLIGTDAKGAEFVRKAIYDFFEGRVIEYYVDYPHDALTKDEIIDKIIENVYTKYGINLKTYFDKGKTQ